MFNNIDLTEADIDVINDLNNVEHEVNGAFMPQLLHDALSFDSSRSAVFMRDRIYSRKELLDDMQKTAGYLRHAGLGVNDVAAVMLRKGYESICTILGIDYAGVAYSPVEYDYPVKRAADCIRSSGAKVLITDHNNKKRLSAAEELRDVTIVEVSEVLNAGYIEKDYSVVDSDDTFAVIFTSGSTGVPKGVMVTFDNIRNCFAHTHWFYGVTEDTRIISVTNHCHDLSIFELFGTLSVGGSVVMPEAEYEKDPQEWVELINIYEANMWDSVPTLANMLSLSAESTGTVMPSMKKVILGGEFIKPAVVSHLKKYFVNAQIYGIGGPTETTIWNICHEITDEDLEKPVIPYGRPIWNSEFYILDDKLNVVPVGKKGVIYNSGRCVTKGYTDSSLTDERYIIHPVLKKRMYNTGDIGSYNADGYIEIHGRSDSQVKINGKRIELEEIENRLLEHSAVGQACACVQNDKIYAFCTLKDDELMSKTIDNWSKVFNETYDEFRDDSLVGNDDFSGWFSSYTHKPIPFDEMLEWRENAIRRIDRIKGKRIFEIGCGTGLIMHRLIGECEKYVGIDISDIAIENLRKEIESEGITNAEVYCGAADELEAYKKEKFDTIIINSVILFFNNADYLLNVIEQCSEMLNDNGCLFIGDVRDYSLMELFNSSVIIHNAENMADNDILNAVKKRMAMEKELLVAPQFFSDVTQTVKCFNKVRIEAKAMKHDNELTKFRYDVTLFKNRASDTRATRIIDESVFSLADEGMIKNIADGNNISVNGLVNRYTAKDYMALCKVKGTESGISDEELETALIPDDIYSFAADNGFDCIVRNRPDGRMDVLVGAELFSDISSAKAIDVNSKEYCNEPYKEYTYTSISDELREYTAEYLPQYMIPSQVEIISKMPVLDNGKTDRKALLGRIGDDNKATEADTETDDAREYIMDYCRNLLGNEPDPDTSFFLIGGHSLLAMKLLGSIKNKFNADIRLSEFMKNPTLNNVIALTEERRSKSESDKPALINDTANRYVPFELNSIQRSYYYGRGSEYLGGVPTCMYLEFNCVELDVEKAERIVNALVKRHEVLRCIVDKDNRQVILQEPSHISLDCTDMGEMSHDEIEKVSDEFYHSFTKASVDLNTFPSFLLKLLKFGNIYRIYVCFDSVFVDGASIEIVIRDFVSMYNDAQLPNLEVSFRDYTLYSEGLKENAEYKQSLDYWLSRADKIPSAPELPVISEYGTEKKGTVRKEAFISADCWQRAKKLGADNGLTPFSVQLCVFALVISRWAAQTHFTLNIPIFNRNIINDTIVDSVGEYGSLIFLEVDIEEDKGFVYNCRKLFTQFEMDIDHRLINGADVLEKLNENGRGFKFPVVFTSLSKADGKGGIYGSGAELRRWHSQSSQVWIDSIIVDKEGGLELAWDCCEGIFNDDMLEDAFEAYADCFRTMLSSEEFIVHSVSGYINGRNYQNIININHTERDYAQSPELLYAGFMKNLEKAPDNIACVTTEKVLTYSELYCYAADVASRLDEGKYVGVYIKRGWKQVAAALGVSISGRAYVPFSKEWPIERIKEIIETADIRYVISDTDEELGDGVKIINISDEVSGSTDFVPDMTLSAEEPAYVIYTSGSTGKPKGVVIRHDSVVNTLLTVNRLCSAAPTDRTIMLSELCFDLSVYDIFGMFYAGGAVFIPSSSEKGNADCWRRLVTENGITIWNTVPSIMSMFVETCENCGIEENSLRKVLMSGDWIALNLPERIKRIFANTDVISLGGATEASIWSNYFCVDKVEKDWRSIPYGYPLDNQHMYVLDKKGRICPEYVEGDIYIGGKGVAVGYLNEKELTEDRFAYSSVMKERLYCTGDRGMYHSDGKIEFLGRNDGQVKLNGFRIELGEIEAAALSDKRITAAVAVFDRKLNYIKLYYISDSSVPENEVRDHLCSKLPSYMIPAALMRVNSFMYTANGKLDKKSLPEIESKSEHKFEEMNDMEKRIAAMFCEAIGISEIGLDDDFFICGGDSVKAIKLIYSISKTVSDKVELTDIFAYPNVKAMSEYVTNLSAS